MKDKNIINISLLCLTVFVVGVSLNIPVPFYPNEALEKGVSVTQSGNQMDHQTSYSHVEIKLNNVAILI